MKMPQGYCNEGGDSVKMFSRSSGGDVTLAVVVSTPIHTERPTPKRSKITEHVDKCNMLGKSQHSFCGKRYWQDWRDCRLPADL